MKILKIASIILVIATAWAFFEWLFFVTKPSFMSLFTLFDKLNVLSSSTLLVFIILLAFTSPFLALAALLRRFSLDPRFIPFVVFLPSALILTAALLVMIDNFSSTLFGYGIRNATGWVIYLYRAGTLALLFFSGWLILGYWNGKFSSVQLRAMTWIATLVLVSSLPLMLLTSVRLTDDDLELSAELEELPNILILSADGIAAEHMSLYGYERNTTPFLDSVRDEFLIAENHFSNASDTGGSVISLFTGKLPTTTKVIYPPDVLRGRDSYQHLPGLLKRIGYYNADISMRHYADPYDLNLRGGFDEANFRKLRSSGGTLIAAIRNIPALNPASMLIDRMSERAAERFKHIWTGKRMMDPLAEVNRPAKRWITDPMRQDEINRFVSDSARPFFLHVHTMGTHGERFRPSRRVFSTEADYETAWSVDGYDDAIADFDRLVEQTYELLKEQGLLESTLLVITSDHGFVHSALDRVPMMLRFPGAARTGTIRGNTQRLDLAPTILAALGIKPMEWMEGESLLKPGAGDSPAVAIFASGSRGDKVTDGKTWSVAMPAPPWYSLGRLHLIHCAQGFVLRLDSMEVRGKAIDGSTAACEKTLSLKEAKQIMLEHLAAQGYEWD